MRGSGKKCKKPPFLVIYAKKGHFGQFLTKMAKTVKIKFQKKVMSGFQEKALRTNGRTNGRTNSSDS